MYKFYTCNDMLPNQLIKYMVLISMFFFAQLFYTCILYCPVTSINEYNCQIY